jgi:hypothetical protein
VNDHIRSTSLPRKSRHLYPQIRTYNDLRLPVVLVQNNVQAYGTLPEAVRSHDEATFLVPPIQQEVPPLVLKLFRCDLSRPYSSPTFSTRTRLRDGRSVSLYCVRDPTGRLFYRPFIISARLYTSPPEFVPPLIVPPHPYAVRLLRTKGLSLPPHIPWDPVFFWKTVGL